MLGGVKVRELEKKDIEVKEEIAVGKSGKVFKGRWGAQDKTIAVKIVISEEVVIREVCTWASNCNAVAYWQCLRSYCASFNL